MIELHNIRLSFGDRILINDASARFECGSMVALLGRNGTGKSTLLPDGCGKLIQYCRSLPE